MAEGLPVRHVDLAKGRPSLAFDGFETGSEGERQRAQAAESVRRQTDEIRPQWPNVFARRTERKELLMPRLSTQERNALPARQFAFPAQRKEPLENASHVRNAIARFDQVQGASDDERDAAWQRIEAAATLYGVQLQEAGWRELFARRGGLQR
jgi:hypothetical protein